MGSLSALELLEEVMTLVLVLLFVSLLLCKLVVASLESLPTPLLVLLPLLVVAPVLCALEVVAVLTLAVATLVEDDVWLLFVLVSVFSEVVDAACELVVVLVLAPVVSVEVLGAFCSLVDEQAEATASARTVKETRLWNFMCEPEEAWQSCVSQAKERSHVITRNPRSAVDSSWSNVFSKKSNIRS